VLEDRAQVIVVPGVDPVDHRLEPPAHDRQRRAQLVRHVGQERASLRVDRAEALAHRVEGARQRAHLTAAALRHAGRVVPALDLRGALDQRRDRRHSAPHRPCERDKAADAAEQDRHRDAAQLPRGADHAERDERGPHAGGDDRGQRQQ
jgi:hypothetical protein